MFIGLPFSMSFLLWFTLCQGDSLTEQNLEGHGFLMYLFVWLNDFCFLQAITKARIIVWLLYGEMNALMIHDLRMTFKKLGEGASIMNTSIDNSVLLLIFQYNSTDFDTR